MTKKICNNGHRYSGEECPYCPGSGPKKPHKTQLFGTTVRETVEILKFARNADRKDKTAQHNRIIIFTRVAVSMVMIVVATLFVVTEEQHGTGIGLFGTVIGYWLK